MHPASWGLTLLKPWSKINPSSPTVSHVFFHRDRKVNETILCFSFLWVALILRPMSFLLMVTRWLKKNRFKFLSCLRRNISRISAQVSRTVKDFRFSIYPGFMGAGRRSESMDRFLVLVSIAKGRLIRILLVCTKISSSKAKRAKWYTCPQWIIFLEWNVIWIFFNGYNAFPEEGSRGRLSLLRRAVSTSVFALKRYRAYKFAVHKFPWKDNPEQKH